MEVNIIFKGGISKEEQLKNLKKANDIWIDIAAYYLVAIRNGEIKKEENSKK